MGLKEGTFKFNRDDMVRIVRHGNMHGFGIGEIVAIVETKVRKDGSHFYFAVGSDQVTVEDFPDKIIGKITPYMWGVTDNEIEMYEKGGLRRIPESEGGAKEEMVYVD